MPISTRPLNDAAKTVTLVLEIDDEGTATIKQFSQNVTQELRKVEKQAEQTTTKMSKSVGGLTSVARSMFSIGRQMTFVTSALVGGMTLATKGVIQYGDALSNMSQKTGVSVETLSSLKIAAEATGTSVGQLASGIRWLNMSIVKASEGNKNAVKVFENLGVSVLDANRKLRPAMEVLGDIADKFKNMEDGAKKTSLAMQIFGRAGMMMIPFLNQGKEGLQKNIDLAKKLGLVLNTDMASAMSELTKRWDAIKAAGQGFAIMIAQYVVPKLIALSEKIINLYVKFKEFREAQAPLIKMFVDFGLKIVLVTTVLSPLLMTVGRLILMLTQLKPILLGIGVALKAALISPAGLAVAAIAGLTVAAIKLINNLKKAKQETSMMAEEAKYAARSSDELRLIFEALLKRAYEAGGETREQIEELLGIYKTDIVKIAAEIRSNNKYQLLQGVLDDIEKYVPEWGEAIKKGLENAKISDAAKKALGFGLPQVVPDFSELAVSLKTLEPVQRFIERTREELEKLKLGIEKVSEDTRNMFVSLEIAWKEDLYDNMKDVEQALENTTVKSQASNESIKKLQSTLISYKKALGITLTDQELWLELVGDAIKPISETKKEISELSRLLGEADKRFKSGQLSQADYAKVMGVIFEKAKDLSPELALLAYNAAKGWGLAKEKIEQYIETIDQLVKQLKDKQQAFDEFNKNIISSFQESAKNMYKSMYENIRQIDQAIDAFYRKAQKKTPVQEVTEFIRKSGIESRKQLMEMSVQIEKVYKDQVEAVNKYYDAEKERFDMIFKNYETEAELIEAINALRIKAQAATSLEDLEKARNEYDRLQTKVKDTYYSIIEQKRNAAIEGLKAEKEKYIEPLLKLIDDLVKKRVKLEEDQYKKLLELAKKHEDWTAQQLAEAIEAGVGDVSDALSVLREATAERFRNLAQLFDILASEMANSFGESITETEKNLVLLVSAFGSLTDAIATCVANGKTDLASLAEAAKRALGQIGAALGGIIGGSSKNYGSIGAGIGASIGGFLGPIGGAIGSFVGGLIGGLFKKKKSAEEKAAEETKQAVEKIKKSYKSIGEISDDVARRIYELSKRVGMANAKLLALNEIMSNIGVTSKNIGSFMAQFNDLLSKMASGAISVEDGLGAINNSFETLINWAITFDQQGSKTFVKFIQNVRKSGVEVKALTSYVYQWLDFGTKGLAYLINAIAPGTDKLMELREEYDKAMEQLKRVRHGSETYIELIKYTNALKREIDKLRGSWGDFSDDLNRTSALVLATFNAYMAQGKSLAEVLETMEPALELLAQKYEALGKTGNSAIDDLMEIVNVRKAHKELFYAIEGNLQVLKALGNTGFLTGDAFQAVAENALDYYYQLMDAGVDSRKALMLIAPTLGDLEWYAKQYGIAIDETTSKLIQQAKEAGVYKEHVKSLTETLESGFKGVIDKIDELIKKIEDGLGGALKNVVSRKYVVPIEVDYAGENVPGAIYGQSGGEWYVGKPSQVFVAHRGEVVKISRPKEEEVGLKMSDVKEIAKEITAEIRKLQPSELVFNINTLDADSFQGVVSKKIVPILSQLAKKEVFTIPYKSVRR